jgi:hypothetical protein
VRCTRTRLGQQGAQSFAQDRIRIKDVDAGFGINGLLAVATTQDANAVIEAEPKWMTRSVPTADRAAVVRSREARGTPIERNILASVLVGRLMR